MGSGNTVENVSLFGHRGCQLGRPGVLLLCLDSGMVDCIVDCSLEESMCGLNGQFWCLMHNWAS